MRKPTDEETRIIREEIEPILPELEKEMSTITWTQEDEDLARRLSTIDWRDWFKPFTI